MTTPTCISCGMPLRSDQDHALGDPANAHCGHCANEDGTLKGFDDVLAGMAAFLTRTQGLDEEAARSAARTMMSRLPAWNDR